MKTPIIALLTVLFIMLFLPMAHAASGDVLFNDTAGGNPSDKWTFGGANCFTYDSGANITMNGCSNNVASFDLGTHTTGTYEIKYDFYDTGFSFVGGEYWGLGFSKGLTPGAGDILGFGSGICSQAQTTYGLYIVPGCSSGTGVPRTAGWHTFTLVANTTDGTGTWTIDTNTSTFTFPAGTDLRYAFFTMGTVVATDFRLRNITVCDTTCVSVPPPVVDNPPVLVTATSSVTSDNTTFVISANATNDHSEDVRFRTDIFKNGTHIGGSTVGYFTQGVLRNYANVSAFENGTYIFQVQALDTNGSSNIINTTPITITTLFTTPPVLPFDAKAQQAANTLVGALIVACILLGIYVFLQLATKHKEDLGLLKDIIMYAIALVIVFAILAFLFAG